MTVFSDTIALEDKVSGPADKAANELNILQKALTQTQNALVKAAALGDVKGFQRLTKNSANLEASISLLPKATPAIQQIAPALQEVGSSSMSADAGLAEMTGGLSIAVTAILAVAAAIGTLIIKGALFAIEMAEDKQAMLGLFDAMGQGKVTGAQTEEMIDGLKAKFGIAKGSLVDWTNQLHQMGTVELPQVEQALHATASAAALVKGGDAAFMSLTKKLQTFVQTGQGLKLPLKGLGSLADMGLTVDDVAKKMGVSAKKLADELKSGTADASKFGDAMQQALIEKGAGPLEKLANSSANIKKIFMENIGDMFEDIDIGPFMKEVKDLFGIFGQAQPSGQALKTGIGAFFQNVFVQATKVVPLIKHFLLDVIIYGLKAYIALKPMIKAIQDFVNSAEGSEKINWILDQLATVAKVVGVGILIVVGAFLLMWAASTAVAIALWALVGAIIGMVAEGTQALTEWVVGAATAAYDFVAGLVEGISNGASQVIGAVKGLASKATGAFKSALGISSPSKVMMGLGGFTGSGFAEGISDASGEVAGATEGLAATASEGLSGVSAAPAAGSAAAGGGRNKGGGISVTATINFNGSVQGANELTEQAVSLIFERIALEQGL